MKCAVKLMLTSGCLLFISTYLAHATQSLSTKEEGAAILNIAGKQRMLTQKISQDVLHLSSEMGVIKKNLEEFENTLNGLLKGDPKRKLPKTEETEMVKQLNKVLELWQPFRDNVKAFSSRRLFSRPSGQNYPAK